MEPSSSFSKRKNNIDPVKLYNYTYTSYDELYRQEQFLKYEYIIINKGFLPEGNILDLGCGTGLLLDFLREKKIKYKRIVCIDPSEKMLELAVYKSGNDPRVIFIQGYAEDLPFDNEVFDTIYMFTVWDNIINKEKAFQELRRVLRRKGIAIISVIDPRKKGASINNLLSKLKYIGKEKDLFFIYEKE